MLNYGITQNANYALEESLGYLPIYDLSLYEEMGNKNCYDNDYNQALSWYSKGLNMARMQQNKIMIKKFENLIYTCI